MMTVLRGLIALAALGLAIGRNVEANGETINDLCKKLSQEMKHFDELKDNAKKAFNFAKTYAEKNTGLLSSGRKLIKAWEAVTNGECSASSWEQFQFIDGCDVRYIGVMDQPMKAYAQKCLTPEYVSRKVKELTSSMFAKRVDMVDSEFLSKFVANGPADPFRWKDGEHMGRTPERYTNTAVDAIKHDFAKRGGDPKKAFQAGSSAVSQYLEKNLFKPCKAYVKNYFSIVPQVRSISLHLEIDRNAFLASLDEEARDIVFRLKYCYQVEDESSFRDKMVRDVAKKFV